MANEGVRQAVVEVVSALVRQRLKDDEPLISSGMIDSLAILRLIAQLEQRLKIRIPVEAVQPDDFDSIQLILETVERVGQPLEPKDGAPRPSGTV